MSDAKSKEWTTFVLRRGTYLPERGNLTMRKRSLVAWRPCLPLHETSEKAVHHCNFACRVAECVLHILRTLKLKRLKVPYRVPITGFDAGAIPLRNTNPLAAENHVERGNIRLPNQGKGWRGQAKTTASASAILTWD